MGRGLRRLVRFTRRSVIEVLVRLVRLVRPRRCWYARCAAPSGSRCMPYTALAPSNPIAPPRTSRALRPYLTQPSQNLANAASNANIAVDLHSPDARSSYYMCVQSACAKRYRENQKSVHTAAATATGSSCDSNEACGLCLPQPLSPEACGSCVSSWPVSRVPAAALPSSAAAEVKTSRKNFIICSLAEELHCY